jgi:transcriptional regulator with XRE-family HTH domain
MKPRVQPYGTKNISGANIERLRKARGMRQFELVQQMQLRGVDINPSSLSKLEGQVRIASDRELYAIAQIFSVTMEELVQPQDKS